MKVYFDRYYITADYKKKYRDYNSPYFKGLSIGSMIESFSGILELSKEWKKDKTIENIRFSVIPAGSLKSYSITLE